MEEEKKLQNSGNGGRGRRRRRHRRAGGGQNPQTQNQNPQTQNQNVQNGQQKQQKPQQNGQKGRGKPQGGESQKNKQNPPKNKNKQSENRKDTYAYALDGNLYINLTNKCSNGCDFCVRNERNTYFGHELWIRNGDPTAEKVIFAIEQLGGVEKFKEVVFCGFGEPTYRMEELCIVADYVHEKGGKIRLNTNGQGSLINKRDILPELKGRIDLLNVSLNAPDSESYKKICRSMFGENGFTAMVEFAKGAKRLGINSRFSVVDCIGEEQIERCKKLAESVNVPLYVRKYIADSE